MIARLGIKIKPKENRGLFHDTRADVKLIASVVNKLHDKINELIDENNKLRNELDNIKNLKNDNNS